MKRNIISFIRKVTYYNQGKKKPMDNDALPIYRCKAKDTTYVASSNNIIRFTHQNETYYFKECRVHSDVYTYIKGVIDDYFNHICDYCDKDIIKRVIYDDIGKSPNFSKLRRINVYVENHYDAIKCNYNGWNVGNVGFPSLYNAYIEGKKTVVEFMEGYCSEFVGYVRNEIYAYDLNNYVKIGNYQVFRPSISIATKKLGNLLGLDDMIPECWYIQLDIDGNRKVGLVTKECKGVCPLNLTQEEKLNISTTFQKEINRMNYFDAVCFQRDHKEENYFVDFNEERQVNRVIALDNDSPMAFFPIPKLAFSTCVLCSPICRGLKPNRPYVDKDFYQMVKRLKISEVFQCVKSELPLAQRVCIAYRVCVLKKVLSRVEVLDDEEWSIATINNELNGEFGKTYLKHYIECNETQLIAEIMGVN